MTGKQVLRFAGAVHKRLWADLGLLIGGAVRYPPLHLSERPRFGWLGWLNWGLGLLTVWFVIASLFDESIALLARELPHETRQAFRAITDFAKSGTYITVLALVLIALAAVRIRTDDTQLRKAANQINALIAYCFVCIAGSGLIVTLLKRLIGRARPKHLDEYGVFSFDPIAVDASFASFPSGHATTGVALAVVVAYLLPRVWFAAACMGVTLAISRVVIGAHYPSDVLFGGVFALVFCTQMRSIFTQRGWLFTAETDGTFPIKKGLRESWIIILTWLAGCFRRLI